MTTYLLDTNVCIALMNGTDVNVRRRFKRAVAREGVLLLSSIVAFELTEFARVNGLKWEDWAGQRR